jgi:uncharacterized protein (TIGR02246 family)
MKRFFLVLMIALFSLSATVQQALAQQSPDEAAIRKVMADSAIAWNSGSVEEFMRSYEDSPLIIFVGPTNTYGFKTVLDRYQKHYATAEQRGTLSFSKIEVRLLPTSTGVVEYAIMTGHFHLDRTTHGESKKDDGYYSLVWHKTKDGWKIILDHTS